MNREKENVNVFLIEDNPGDARLIKEMLSECRDMEFVLQSAGTLKEGLELLSKGGFDVILLDLSLPDSSGIETLNKVRCAVPHMPVVLMTGMDSRQIGVEAVKNGAQDYLVKGSVDPNLLMRSLTYAIKRKQIEEDLRKSREELREKHTELSNLFGIVETAKREWERTMDCVGSLIIVADNKGRVKRCNREFMKFVGTTYQEIIGRGWKELLFSHDIEATQLDKKNIELYHKPSGRWFILNNYPFKDIKNDIESSEISGTVIAIHDTTELKGITEELQRKNKELDKAYGELKATQSKILQQEKMASIGQLAAGVAHEINNPIGFISSNLGTLKKYIDRISDFITAQSDAINKSGGAPLEELNRMRESLKLDFIIEDTRELIDESIDGAERVRDIVLNLKNFSRVDKAESHHADINECIESTIKIVWNEIKYKAELKKDYGDIPLTKCYPQQLNQVFMNILVNAAHAIGKKGEISVKTWNGDGSIHVSIADTGCGISEKNINKIFEPFFTTKEVGKGTGLGLSIVYDIIKKHDGDISVKSEVGKGTEFIITIPVVEGR